MAEDFKGAKAATFIGERLLILLRDDKPDIDFPAHWDFPGGGRDPGETGEETLAREMREEVGLDLGEAEIVWRALLPARPPAGLPSWFFVVRFPEGHDARIVFGDEGQGWELASVAETLAKAPLVPSMGWKLRLWLERSGEGQS